jgi:hypothetical protein
MQFCFCMYATKTLEKQKQNFTLYRSTVLLLCVYYKNACKSKSKTLPSTVVQFCFCMYTTKTLAKAKAKRRPLQEYSFAFVCILKKRLQKQKQNFSQYWSSVLLLYVVYYKNACESKSKTSPSTGVQFCFYMNILLPASKQQP